MVRKLWWRLCARILYVEKIKAKKQNLEYGG